MLPAKHRTMFDHRFSAFTIFYYDSCFSAIQRQQFDGKMRRVDSRHDGVCAPAQHRLDDRHTGPVQFAIEAISTGRRSI